MLIGDLNYTAWGEVRYSSGTTPANYTYTGQYSHVADFGLMYYNARWYDPSLGRFAQADSIIPQSQGVQAWDRYAYANNNPVRYTDPSGHCIGPVAVICVDALIVATVAVGIWAIYDIGLASDQALQMSGRRKVPLFNDRVINVDTAQAEDPLNRWCPPDSKICQFVGATLLATALTIGAVTYGCNRDDVECSNYIPTPEPGTTSTPTLPPTSTPTMIPTSTPMLTPIRIPRQTPIFYIEME